MNMCLSHVSGVQKKALNPLASETLWIVGVTRGCWELISGPLPEPSMVLKTEQSLQAPCFTLKN